MSFFFGKKVGRQGPRLPIDRDVINKAAEGTERKTVFANMRAAVLGSVTYMMASGSALPFGIFKTMTAVSPRTGVNPGSCTGVLVTVYDSVTNSLSYGSTTYTFRNISAYAGWTTGGKHGFYVVLFGTYWIVALEC